MMASLKDCFHRHCLIFFIVNLCVISIYGQNIIDNNIDSLNLCENEGLFSCICDESTNVNNLHLLRVMCSFQNISVISDSMTIPNNSEILDFSVNNIEKLNYSKIFDNLNIKLLHLNRNKINYIAVGTFVDLSNLSELDLSENELEVLEPGVFHGIYKLKRLYLYCNKFTSLQQYTFQGLPVLELLSLSDNNIGPHLLSIPDIFTPQGLSLNPKIETLLLNNINISDIPPNFFDNAYNMRELYLKRNPISTFPSVPFTLEVLDISGTQISSLNQGEFLYLPAVKHLYLNDLQNLTTIDRYTFMPMKGLKKIELQNCKGLRDFDRNAFGVATNGTGYYFPVEDINLMGSGLRSLDANLMQFFSKLSNLDLRSNPWVCDCKLKWLLELQLNNNIRQQIRCDRPPNLQGKLLFSLKPQDLECQPWNRVVNTVTRITLVLFCLSLGGLAIWLVILWPPQDRGGTRQVGPDSPYSRITTIQPNRPDDEL